MNPISKSNFAKKVLGKTPQYIDKIEHRLTMVKVPGKKKRQVDLHGALTLEFLAEREIRHEESTPEPQPQPKKQTKKQISTEIFEDDLTKVELEKLKIKEQTEQIKIKNAMIRGDLIEKKLVVMTHSALASIDENQFKSLNVTIGPKIDAVYTRGYSEAVDQIVKLLKKEKDTELKTNIAKILNSGSDQRKKEVTEIIEDDTGKVLKNIQREFDLFLERCEE